MFDICREFSSSELKYMASVAEGYERMQFRHQLEKKYEDEFKGKNIPVLKYLFKGAQEIATCFANVRYHYDIMYGHEGTYYVLRENKIGKHEYIIMVKLDYKTDEVVIYPSAPNILANVNDIKECINNFSTSTYTWVEQKITDTELHYKIEWSSREEAFSRMAEDEEYICDLGDKLFNGCYGM